MMMAGLDGIQNKIHPGDAADKNLYDLPPEELAQVPTVCGSLREALNSLEADHEFLLKGGVFTKDMRFAAVFGGLAVYNAFSALDRSTKKE